MLNVLSPRCSEFTTTYRTVEKLNSIIIKTHEVYSASQILSIVPLKHEAINSSCVRIYLISAAFILCIGIIL